MKRSLKKFVNSIIDNFGFQIVSSIEMSLLKNKYIDVTEELQQCFREEIFPDIPKNGTRSKLIANLIGTTPSESIYLINYLHQSMKFDGDICEFGVAQGRTSTLLANEISGTNRNLWLYDSFQGLPKPTEKDHLIDDIFHLGEMGKYQGTMSSPRKMVEAELKTINFPEKKLNIHEGFIEGVIDSAKMPDKVCFAYADFDFYQPILDVLMSLDNCLVVGGHVMVDDYEFFSSGVKTAVEEFMADHKGKYELILPKKFAGKFCILKRVG